MALSCEPMSRIGFGEVAFILVFLQILGWGVML